MAKATKVIAQGVFGVVDGFDCVKNFGFIRYEGRTIYTHRSHITESGFDAQRRRYLLRDQVVLFDLCEGPKGFMACNVRVKVQYPPPSQKLSPDIQTVEKNVPGHIISVKNEKKFCIIRTNCEEYETLLGHFSNFKQTPDPGPKVGASVLCDVGRNHVGKYVAVRIRVKASKAAGDAVDISSVAGLQQIAEGVEGRVVSVKKERGFAIIETDEFGTLLCHYTNIQTSGSGPVNLQLRQKVICDVMENKHKKNKVAVNVKPGEVPELDLAEVMDDLELGAASETSRDIAAIEDELICFICFCVLENPVTFPCEHLFCWECIYKWLEFQESCPVDRKKITIKDMKPAPRFVKNILEKMAR